MRTLELKTSIVVLVAVALLCLAAPYATAEVITLNFDSVDTSGGDVDATAFLNSFGITLANVSPTSPAGEVQIRKCWWQADENFLMQNGGGATVLLHDGLQHAAAEHQFHASCHPFGPDDRAGMVRHRLCWSRKRGLGG